MGASYVWPQTEVAVFSAVPWSQSGYCQDQAAGGTHLAQLPKRGLFPRAGSQGVSYEPAASATGL